MTVRKRNISRKEERNSKIWKKKNYVNDRKQKDENREKGTMKIIECKR